MYSILFEDKKDVVIIYLHLPSDPSTYMSLFAHSVMNISFVQSDRFNRKLGSHCWDIVTLKAVTTTYIIADVDNSPTQSANCSCLKWRGSLTNIVAVVLFTSVVSPLGRIVY